MKTTRRRFPKASVAAVPLPGGGALQLMVQAGPVFKHCHDVCVDDEKNPYVCPWNAGGTYPIKLHRV